MKEHSYQNSFKAVCDKLVALAKEQSVVGAPIRVGDTAILPLSALKVGVGGGGGQGFGEGDPGGGRGTQAEAVASAGFGGVKVTPMALIVIDGDSVTLETLDDNGGVK